MKSRNGYIRRVGEGRLHLAKTSFFAATLSFLALSTICAQSNDLFAKANQEYAAGHFKSAIHDYTSVVDSGKWSANLFYDLGNAYFRDNDFGHSILNYERALALERHHPEAAANLSLVRDQARALELAPDQIEQFLQFGTPTEFAIAATVALWIAVFCIARLVFASRRSRTITVVAVLSLLVCGACGFAAYWLEAGSNGQSLGIVTGDGVQARLATAENAGSVLALPPGTEIKILRQRGDWIYAALPNNLRGWIPENSAERVRL